MRYTGPEDYREKAGKYAVIIGYLLTKTGPLTITVEDLEAFGAAELIATAIPKPDGIDLLLLDREEFAQFERTGRNPRD